MTNKKSAPPKPRQAKRLKTEDADAQPGSLDPAPPEFGGPRGKEPTRYGDWEKNGRCIDF